MALTKCKMCGSPVSSNATECPRCGCPIEKDFVCTDCGQVFSSELTECPECGCPASESSRVSENDNVSRPTHECTSRQTQPVPDTAYKSSEMEEYTYIKPKPGMFRNPFSFNGRIRRTEYGITCIIGFFVNFLFTMVINSYSYYRGGIGVSYLFLIPFCWFLLAQGAKRCHDLGHSGWYQIIPLYWLWLLFAEGDSSTNEYGYSPK